MKSIVFLTSNRAKLMHARHLAGVYNVEVLGKRNYGKAYNEPRLQDRKLLFEASYRDALGRWSRDSNEDGFSLFLEDSPVRDASEPNTFFFFEDTSVIVEALSSEGEVPGPDVKYWMKEMNFERLDRLLRSRGNNRRVVVRSDVVLHIPFKFRQHLGIADRYLVFTATSEGSIVSKERQIQTNLLYPWLDDRTFNKWFVPLGQRIPLSAMPIDRADRHDFRARSIGSMFDYLCVHGFVDKKRPLRLKHVQTPLPRFNTPVLLVTGLPCAGKTTLGSYLSEHYGYFHIEASDFMKRAFYERHGTSSGLSIHGFAENALLKTPEVVVAPVIKELERSRAMAVVITGFRSPVEIDIFKREFRGESPVLAWHIECSRRLRYLRSMRRARKDAATSRRLFLERDLLQLRMGLAKIKAAQSGLVLKNSGTKRQFFQKISMSLEISTYREWKPLPLSIPKFRPRGLEDAILISMATSKDGSPISTTEVARLVNMTFPKGRITTNKNNVSRYFNFRHSAYYNVDTASGVALYTLSATGRSKAMQLLGRIRGSSR